MASSYFAPNMDSDDHHTYNDDNNVDSSPSQDYDIPDDSFDYNDDFLDHDFSSTYLSYPVEIAGLLCSTTQQPLDTPSSSLLPPDASANLNPDKELTAEPMSDTACLDTGNECTIPADSLESQTYLLLPDYAGTVLPPLTNTVFTLNDARFKYPAKSSPVPEMNVDDRTDQQILSDIVRTCSLNLTKEEVDIYDKVAGKSVMFPEAIRQDTYRIPKTLLDSAIKDLKLNKSQAETLQQDIHDLPEYIDCHDQPPPPPDPPEQELVDITVQDKLTQLNEHVDSLLITRSTLCLAHCNKNHKLQSIPHSSVLFDIKQKIVASQQTTYDHFLSNDKDIDILIDVCISLQPSNKTMSKIIARTMNRPVCKKTVHMMMNFLIHKSVVPPCWQTGRKIVSFLLSHLFQSIKLNVTVNCTCINAILDSGSTYSILSFYTWEKLGIKLSDLNTSTIFNITSATSTCANAIAGTVDLFVTLHFVDGQKEVIKHTFLCASQRMALGVNLLGVDFLIHHGININSTNSLLQVTKRNNLLYQDTFQDSISQNSVFFLESNSLHDPNISGSLDIPIALSELRESTFDFSQDIEVYRTTDHDFFQHEADLSIIPNKDAISFDQLDLGHLSSSTAKHLRNTLKP